MAYLDGELPVNRATVAAAHLEGCTECQSLASDVRGVSRRLCAWEIEVPRFELSPETEVKPEKRRRW